MMSSIPPAAANDVATLLQIIKDPDGVQARLDAIKAAHADLDTRSKTLGDYETQLSAREHAVAVREQVLKSNEDDHIRIATALEDSRAQHEAEKAAFDAMKVKNAADYETARGQVNQDFAHNQATARKLAAQRDELAGQEVAIRAMRLGLEEREKAVEEAEAALAAKQERLAKALQG